MLVWKGRSTRFPEDPEAVIDGLRNSGSAGGHLYLHAKSLRYRAEVFVPNGVGQLGCPASHPLSTTGGMIRYALTHATVPAKRKRRGVTFREVPFGEDLIRGICRIYNETPVRQGKGFSTLRNDARSRLTTMPGTFLDQSVYIGAFVGDTMIGFIKLTMDEDRSQACMVHILSMIQHNDKSADQRPDRARRCDIVRGTQRIPSPDVRKFNYGNKQGDSPLREFKKSKRIRTEMTGPDTTSH